MTLGWGEESGHWHKPCPTVHKILLRSWFITTLPFDVNLICSLCSSRQDVDLGSVTDLSLCFFVFVFPPSHFYFLSTEQRKKYSNSNFIMQETSQYHVEVKKKKKKCFCLTPYFVHAIAQLLFFVCGIVVFL